MATTSSAPTERPALRSNNRRRGWVIASEDGSEVERPTSFDARRSAAAWNKGNGPSKASIPSRASSLASPAASPTIPSAALQSVPIETPSTSSTTTVETRPVPPPRVPSSSGGHSRDESTTSTDAESSTGKRRPSPPLLAPPKQTYRKVPSTRVLPPSAWSDHQKFMAAAGAGSRPTPLHTALSSTGSSSTASASQSPTAKKPPTLRSDMALLAAQRRSNSSSGSSAVTMSSSAAQSTTTPATSAASTPLMAMQNNGKEKALARSTLQDDDQEFFSSSLPGSSSFDASSNAAVARPSSQQSHFDRATPKTSLLFSPNPLPPLSEKSANSDLEDALTSTSEHASDSEATISTHAKPGKRRDSVRIELPPPPAQFKDRYPSIMVDSTHASDSEANGANNSGQRRRRRRSTASNSNKLGAEGEDDEDDEDDYADDDSSWPSTPSTTPLEAYFAAADAGTRPHRKTVQTTKEIIAPASNSIGMDRPMVVVTSPSTASEVSSDQHSSSGSASTSDRVSSSSPPAAPVLSKIEEHPAAKAAAWKAEASSSAPPRRSLSFELPAVPRTRASEENLPIATPVRSPSPTMAFLAKINPTRTSNNRSSADLASSGRPEESVAAVEQAKRMSLDGQKRTSSEQRRSVELRPILLNAASRPPSRPVGAAAESDTTGQAPAKPIATSQEKQQRRRSSGRVPIRPNVVPYYSQRSSEISVGSSNVSPLVQDRGSFDEEASDSRYSPSSQETALTMPSPAMSSDAKPFSAQPARTPDRRSSTAGAKKDRFAASMPSLHQQQSSQERMVSRRTPSHEQAAENRPSAIGLLVDSQKGRMTRDNESIAEWISVSVNDLPLPAETQTYGNGGAGEFSNKNEEAKKARKNKPWKFGRFAASEVVLPAKNISASPISPSSGTPVLPKRRPISFVKRASTAQVNNASRASADSVPAPQPGPFMRNLGFTTANRNVVLQSLCAERSISALAASTIYIAGCGRINVPQPGPKPDGKIKSKAKSKAQDGAGKRQSQRSSKAASMPVPVEEVATDLVSPCYSAEASHDAYLNVAEERHTGYSLSGTGIGTVKSMVPEMGDWSGSSHHDSGPNEEVQEVRPFRDYDDEGSDLFDSDRSESQPESEDEMDFDEDDDEDAEVPVRFGQRINLANSGETASPQVRSSAEVRRHPTSMQEKNVDNMAVSKSLESISPGVVMLRGAELHVCVEEDAGQDGEDLAYWKAVKVQQTSGQSDNADQASQSFEGQVRRQPSSKAMKLEQEVATGIFAAFVGNRSPRRQAVQRTSFDAGSSKDQGSPQKRGPVSAKDGIKGLLVSKLNEGAFSVRSEVHSTIAGEEQVVDIVRHSGGRRSSLQASSREASDSTDGAVSRRTGAPLNRLERAFPSPLLTNADFSHNRSQSNQTDGSRASLDESERVTMRIQRHGGRGFVASFQARDGHQWVWQGSKLEASVFAPSKDRTSSQGLYTLEGYDLSLRAVVGSEMIELATFSTESQLRNALGLFKPRGKSIPKPLPEDGASVGPAVPPPAQVLPLAVAMRGMARAEPQVPRRGIRGGPLLRPQPPAAGCAARHHGMWQNQRAAISTEAVVQVHNNAVNNTKASLQLNDCPGSSFRTGALGSHRRSVEVARSSDETVANKKMGELSFSAIEHLDRDLVVLSLLTVMGVARV